MPPIDEDQRRLLALVLALLCLALAMLLTPAHAADGHSMPSVSSLFGR